MRQSPNCPLTCPDLYAPSLHDALPIFPQFELLQEIIEVALRHRAMGRHPIDQLLDLIGDIPRKTLPDPILYFGERLDRKSTRLNSSHVAISYAVFCLKQKRNADFTLGY